MSNDQNWIEATSASEMAAISSFMAGSRESFPKQAIDLELSIVLSRDRYNPADTNYF